MKQRVFVHTQQDVILCPGLMVQPCLNLSLPINNHVPCNCAVSSLRASSPFGGYREKKTREIHATGDAKVGGGPSRLRRSLAPSLATRFARPNRRACSQPMLYEWRFSFYPPFPSSPVNNDCVPLTGLLRVFVCEYFKGTSGC